MTDRAQERLNGYLGAIREEEAPYIARAQIHALDNFANEVGS